MKTFERFINAIGMVGVIALLLFILMEACCVLMDPHNADDRLLLALALLQLLLLIMLEYFARWIARKIGLAFLAFSVLGMLATAAHGQLSNPSVLYVGSAPSGTCSQSPPIQLLNSNGHIYTCNNGTWTDITASGSGTVTSFTDSSGLFSVATSTTTPTTTYATQSPNTAFGNFTGSTAAPSFTATTGTGSPVAATSPTLVTPALGTPASGVITNLTGTCTACTATTATNATNVSNTGANSTNASFFPLFVAANTTSNQGTNTTAGLSFNPSTNLLTTTGGGRFNDIRLGTTGSDVIDTNSGGDLQTSNTFRYTGDNTNSINLGTAAHRWVQLFLGPTGIKLGDGTNGPTITTTGSSPNENLVLTKAGTGGILMPAYTSGATTFTASGCGTAGSVTGGASAGSFTVGTGATNCTFTITINGATGYTAPHGWVANADDTTANIHCVNSTTVSTTTVVFVCTGTIATSDLIKWSAIAY